MMEPLKNVILVRPVAGTQAIHRAMQVLRCIAQSRNEGIGLSALCKQAGLVKSTAHRLVMALVAEGLVEQDRVSRRYFVGSECHVLGLVAADRFGLHKAAIKHVSRLAHETGDAAFFSIRQDVYSLCLLREEGDFPLKSYALAAGDRHPLGVGAGSQAMLAALSDDQVQAALDCNLGAIEKTYPNYNRRVLEDLVREGRDQGYSVNKGLVLVGSWGVGMAVRDEYGQVIGALSIATVDSRLDGQRQRQLAALLDTEARSMEKDLQRYGGYLSRPSEK